MDLITIKFIGLILLFQTSAGPNPVRYTMFAADGTPKVNICGTTIPEHHAYLRVVGPAISANWSTAPAKCETEGANPHTGDCLLYELDHDDLVITTVSNSTVGVTKMPTVNGIVPKLRDFDPSAQLDALNAHARSAATLQLNTGTLEGIQEFNDMRTMKLVVRQGAVHLDSVTIESATRPTNKIVVPAGAQLAIINMPAADAADKPGEMTGHDDETHWYLHYSLLDNPPAAAKCFHPISLMSLRKQHTDPPSPSHPKTLSKVCSSTTYP